MVLAEEMGKRAFRFINKVGDKAEQDFDERVPIGDRSLLTVRRGYPSKYKVLWIDCKVGREVSLCSVAEKVTSEYKETNTVFVKAGNEIFVDLIFEIEVFDRGPRGLSIRNFERI